MSYSPMHRHSPPQAGQALSARNASTTPFAPRRTSTTSRSATRDNTVHSTAGSCYGETPYQTDTHLLSVQELEQQFRTDVQSGLDTEHAAHLLSTVGPNTLTPPEKESQLVKLLKHVFCGVFNILLWIASVGQLALYFVFPEHRDRADLIVPAVMIFVIVSAGTFQWYQERHSEQIMSSFASFIPQSVTVIRGGKSQEISPTRLVPGDIVVLTAGEKIPADIRVVECSPDMQVDNSSLTGESEPQARGDHCTHRNPMETKNLAFLGTLLLRGRGKGVVYATGDNTLLGKIAQLAGSSSHVTSTFTEEVEGFVALISYIAISIGIACMVFDVYRGENIKTTIYFAISIIMANIPEGLVPTVTLSLTLSAKRMSRRQVLVRNLESVETLGCVSVVCSDKTGTITCGRMSVSHVFTDMKTVGFRPRYLQQSESVSLKSVTMGAILCNNAAINCADDVAEEERITGFPTETGLLRAAATVAGGVDAASKMREAYPVVHEIPFNSDNKWQLSIHRYPPSQGKSGFLLLLKGAPERVIDLCGHYSMRGEEKYLTEEKASDIQQEIMQVAELGERVLCFAKAHLDLPAGFKFVGDHFDSANWSVGDHPRGGAGGLVFCGFMSLIDPPRQQAADAIERCQQAGIKVVMVTGDHHVTAAAIARQVGIIDGPKQSHNDGEGHVKLDVGTRRAMVVTGAQLDKIIEQGNRGDVDALAAFWDHVLGHDSLVFARTTPVHKMIIVQEFQKRGAIVAVTGDGVNDAPALNQANVGIAMGRNGTDVAREASDIILMDDNFASIVNGVEEGRLIADNLKKSIVYTMCSKLPQLAPTIARILFGLPPAMTMLQVILIDLGTDIWTGVAMAYEKKEDEIMKRKPRSLETDPLVTWKMLAYSYLHVGVLQTLGCFFTFQYIMQGSGRGVSMADLVHADANWGKETMFCYQDPEECRFDEFVDPERIYSHHLTAKQQQDLLQRAQTGFYVALILMQVCAALCSETRVTSLFKHGLQNMWLNMCILLEILLGAAIVYVPFMQVAFETQPLELSMWFVAAPFMALFILIEEFRKYYARRCRGWVGDLLTW